MSKRIEIPTDPDELIKLSDQQVADDYLITSSPHYIDHSIDLVQKFKRSALGKMKSYHLRDQTKVTELACD